MYSVVQTLYRSSPQVTANLSGGSHKFTCCIFWIFSKISASEVHKALICNKVMFTLDLVWPMSRVEPGWWAGVNRKITKKTQPGSKILTLEIAGFNPGSRRVRPSWSVVWTEIADYDPGYQKLGLAWAAEIGIKGCFASPDLSLATSYDFWHGVVDVFDDSLQATTVAYYRHWHPPWWSKVTGYWHETVNFWVQYAILPMWIEARQISPR